MGKIIATGNLSGTSDQSDPVRLDGKYTGDYGILLSGDFDTSTANVYVFGLINPHTGADQNYGYYSPSGTLRGGLSYDEPGMYFLGNKIGNYLEAFAFLVESSFGATDIDWTLFLKARP
jgi:hypothetical protein